MTFRNFAQLMTVLAFLCSCTDRNRADDSKVTPLESVEFIQIEEVTDSPLTLAFSWYPVTNADSYSYALYEFVEDFTASSGSEGSEKFITEGCTTKCGKMFTASDDIQLYSGTNYILKVQATSLKDKYTPSEYSEAKILTGAGPFKLSITNLTYRSGNFKAVPSDNSILYQCAVIDLSKYNSYSSDREFIETYDFGYYKHIVDVWSVPMPWYEYMKSNSEKKTKEFTSRSLNPGSEYIFYAYRTDYTSNESEPVKISGFTKKIFTAPQWQATSTCSFDVEVKSQTLISEGTEVNVEVNVKPSDKSESYTVMFMKKTSLDTNSPFNTVSNLVRNYELLGGISSWDTSGYTWKGERTISSHSIAMSDQAHVFPSGEYAVAVFGLNDSGCITTDISVTYFTSIVE